MLYFAALDDVVHVTEFFPTTDVAVTEDGGFSVLLQEIKQTATMLESTDSYVL